MRQLRVVLVGEASCGKSSLITSLVTESFQAKVPPVIPQVTITAGIVATIGASTRIVDTSSNPIHERDVYEELRLADVTCIVFDSKAFYTADEQERETLLSNWLSRILSVNSKIPIILVATQYDKLSSRSAKKEVADFCDKFVDQNESVEVWVHCSAKNHNGVEDVFFHAQRVVIYPATAFNSKTNKLNVACKEALKRIFILCDEDRDNLLSNDEVKKFQEKCFGSLLSDEELTTLKNKIRADCPTGIDRETDAINCVGFIYIHQLVMKKDNREFLWSVLRAFGYGDNLRLKPSFLKPPELTRQYTDDTTCELTESGYNFLKGLFINADKDKDGLLSPQDVASIFNKMTPGNPWGPQFPAQVQHKAEYVTLEGFLSQWSMTTMLDYTCTIEYLVYLGHPDVKNAVKFPKINAFNERKVFQCLVVGSETSGKTTLLKTLSTGGELPGTMQTSMSSNGPVYACNRVADKCYLVMREISIEYFMSSGLFKSNAKVQEQIDCVCMIYDMSDPKSFATLPLIQQVINQSKQCIPCIYIANKADVGVVRQEYECTPAEYCKRFDICKPHHVSLKNDPAVTLHKHILDQLKHPTACISNACMNKSSNISISPPIACLVLVSIGAFVVGWYRWKRNN